MGYTRQLFKDGEVLSASQLNHIEDGLLSASKQFNCWEGKTAVFVGDSITYTSGSTLGYFEVLKKLLGFSKVTGLGVSGSCISAESDYGTTIKPLSQRYLTIPDADLIVIFMGTNDYGHETPMGTIEDTTDISFYGALNVIIPGIITAHPQSRIVFCTPLHRYGYGTSSVTNQKFTYDHIPNGKGKTLKDYVNAIKEVCERYGIPVIDLFSQSGMNPCVSEIKNLYFPDGLHPNEAGHIKIAHLMGKYLNLYALQTPYNESKIMNTSVNMVIGMKAGGESSASDKTIISTSVNLFLTNKTIIYLKKSRAHALAIYKCASEVVSIEGNNLISGGWIEGPYEVTEDGWYNICIKKDNGKEFDLSDESINLWDYIEIFE